MDINNNSCTITTNICNRIDSFSNRPGSSLGMLLKDSLKQHLKAFQSVSFSENPSQGSSGSQIIFLTLLIIRITNHLKKIIETITNNAMEMNASRSSIALSELFRFSVSLFWSFSKHSILLSLVSR